MSVTASSASSADATYSDVHLAIYDLSHGMARSLSAQFLGQQHAIDIIPHTGIIVYGKEYYFGSMGIEASDPSHFRQSRNIFPIETQHLGRTSVPREDFEQWCRSLSLGGESTYAGHNYDLLNRNCNNFSHHAATVGLQLNKGAPEWVLNVPQRFLASPMGQMMRPMLENMQLSGPTGGGTGFGSSNSSNSINGNSNSNSNSGNSTMANNYMDTSTSASASTAHDAADYNPWANLPSKNNATSTSNNASANTANGSSAESRSEDMAISPATKHSSSSSSPTTPPSPSPPKKQKMDEIIKTPTLDSYTKPLLSSETKMVPLCIQKIKSSAGIKAMEEMERQRIFATLDSLPETLSRDSKSGHDHHNDSNGDDNGHAHLPATIDLLVRLSQMPQVRASERTFILMLIRLAVLNVKNGDILIPSMEVIKNNFITSSSSSSSSSSMTATNTNTALKSMAWCVLSNAIGSFGSEENATAARGGVHWDEYIDAAIGELSGENRVEIRQSAAAFLYNFMLYLNKVCSSKNDDDASTNEAAIGDSQVSDLHVMILCGVLEGLVEETDTTVLTRKLLIVGKVVSNNTNAAENGHGHGNGNGHESPKDGNASGSGLGINDIAASLVVDLGYIDAIKESQSLEIALSNEVITKLTREIVAIVSQSYSS